MTTNNHLTRLSFRVKPDERRQIVADAKLAGLSIGSHIRARLLAAPQTAPTYRRTETRLLMKHLIGHIGRVGNNLNQIAWKLNSSAVLVSLDRAELEDGLRSLKDMRSLLIAHLLQRGGPC